MSQTVAPVTDIAARGYAHPEVLVSTQWVADHLDDPAVRIVESDEDVLLYETGHIPGAVKVDWVADLNDPLVRDYIDRGRLERLLRSKGINDDTTIVLYGDKNNWWATDAFWVFRLFGLERLRVMDGGRLRWQEEGRPIVTKVPRPHEGNITVRERDDARIRAFRDDVAAHVRQRRPLVDVRSPEEDRGERLHMADYPNEGALRGGHIPGARNVPWGRAVDPASGTFKDAAALRAVYEREMGLNRGDAVVTYCRIGERSSHTWFVLTYLLGYPRIRNSDITCTERGKTAGMSLDNS